MAISFAVPNFLPWVLGLSAIALVLVGQIGLR
jgi:hypothetical protein